MKKEFERFDMKKPPIRTRWFLRPLTYILCAPEVKKHKTIITKTNCEGLKPPYVLLCNHNAFFDFKVATKCIYPNRANYVVAIDGFIGREWLLRNVGCICKRKFTNDPKLVLQLKRTIKNGDIAVIYPEARYSLCGTTAVLPESLGKLCKHLNVPVVTLICHGHHINSPFWNLHPRNVVPTEAEFKQLFTAEDLKNHSIDEINEEIVKTFEYDDYKWQKEKDIHVTYEKRAEGLHKVLYQCPHCLKEYRMASRNNILYCEECKKEWEYTELGELKAVNGETEFSHIPDWYEWERSNVRKEVENGTYSTGEVKCSVMSLPNAKKFIELGEGTIVHDMNGFVVKGIDKDGDEFLMEKPVSSMYSCHIEYEYLNKYGDRVDLNTLDDTWYIRPLSNDFAVTKIALATEELYFKHLKDQGKTIKKGLA